MPATCLGAFGEVPTKDSRDRQLLAMFILFNTIVVRDGLDAAMVHQAFLAIDEYPPDHFAGCAGRRGRSLARLTGGIDPLRLAAGSLFVVWQFYRRAGAVADVPPSLLSVDDAHAAAGGSSSGLSITVMESSAGETTRTAGAWRRRDSSALAISASGSAT